MTRWDPPRYLPSRRRIELSDGLAFDVEAPVHEIVRELQTVVRLGTGGIVRHRTAAGYVDVLPADRAVTYRLRYRESTVEEVEVRAPTGEMLDEYLVDDLLEQGYAREGIKSGLHERSKS